MKLLSFFVPFALIPVFIACDKEKEEPDTDVDSITLYVDKTQDLGVKGDFLSSDNSFVASVSKEGIVTANHVGTTYIHTRTKKIPTTVIGMYYMYDDPVTDWGCSPRDVMSKQKQGSLKGAYSNHSLLYENVSTATALMYQFDDNDKLKGVALAFPMSYVSRVTDHLMERYFMIPYVSGDIMAIGHNAYDVDDATVAVSLMYVNTNNFMVIYIPGSAAKK